MQETETESTSDNGQVQGTLWSCRKRCHVLSRPLEGGVRRSVALHFGSPNSGSLPQGRAARISLENQKSPFYYLNLNLPTSSSTSTGSIRSQEGLIRE